MTLVQTKYYPKLSDIKKASVGLQKIISPTPLQKSIRLSTYNNASIFLKREDLQQVRSYKIRGAYNKIDSLSKKQLENGIICASAGNHAQGVAFACNKKKIHGIIYMPETTPKQKVQQVKMFGGAFINIQLEGDTFDDAFKIAKQASEKLKKAFIHPFDDKKIIEGQATVALEILEQATSPIDYVFVPVGGGGLLSGISTVFKNLSPHTKIIGIEPLGAPSMTVALENNEPIKLEVIDGFVDGAAVQKVGQLNYDICAENKIEMIKVPEGKVCQTILDMYNNDAIVVEPAGALTISALDLLDKKDLANKNIICILSGSNNDITRTAEIKERALLYGGLKHYFIVNFPQRAGALREFVLNVISENDDITYFEYSKKTSRTNAPAVVGIELEKKDNFQPLVKRMKALNFYGEYLNDKPHLFEFLI